MTVLLNPTNIEPILQDLTTLSKQLDSAQADLDGSANGIQWEGAGVDRYKTQISDADRNLTFARTTYGLVEKHLRDALSDQTGARAKLVTYEDYVMGQAKASSDPAAYFKKLGWTQTALPSRYDTEWESLAIKAGYRP